MEKFVDLYEITVKVECYGTGAHMEKYPAKQTEVNFLPLQVSDEQFKQGYSIRMYGRVPVGDLMKLRRREADASDHVARSIYCFKDQREEAYNKIVADITKTVTRLVENATKLRSSWDRRSGEIKTKQLHSKEPK